MASANKVQQTFHHLYTQELSSFIDELKAIEHLPASMRKMIAVVERNIAQNRQHIVPSILGGMIIGATVGAFSRGIFSLLSKKEKFRKLSSQSLVTIEDNITHFQHTIMRMK